MSTHDTSTAIMRCWVHGGKRPDTAKDCPDRRHSSAFRSIGCAFVPPIQNGSEEVPR